MTTNNGILWHCCLDCDNGNHNARCGNIDGMVDDNNDSKPLDDFLNRIKALNRCQECYDMLSPLELLSNIEL